MNRTVLIVDDAENIREVLKMTLEMGGYRVVTAVNGLDALEKFGTDIPDLIILDVMMPEMNGYQVCRTIREKIGNKEIPVIMLTAKSRKEDKFWGLDCGASEYVAKPFNPDELLELVNRLINREKNEDTHYLSGIHTFKGFLENMRQRFNLQKGFICRFRFEEQPFEIFSQKYGYIKSKEFISNVENIVKDLSSEIADGCINALFAQVSDTDFLLAYEGNDDVLKYAVNEIEHKINALTEVFYDKEDIRRGFVEYKTLGSGKVKMVPLLSVKTSVHEMKRYL